MAMSVETTERICPLKGIPTSVRRRRSAELAETAVPMRSGTANSAASHTRNRTGQGRFSRTFQTSFSEASSSRMRGMAEATRATNPTQPATLAEASLRMPRRVASALSASPGDSSRSTSCSIRRSKASSPTARSRTRASTAMGISEKMLM